MKALSLLTALLVSTTSLFAAIPVFKKTASVRVNDRIMVNFATDIEYTIPARLVIESGYLTNQEVATPYIDEAIFVTAKIGGKTKVFEVEGLNGRIVSAGSDTGSEDAGVYIEVRQGKGSINSYRIEFLSPKKGAVPTEIRVNGPIYPGAG